MAPKTDHPFEVGQTVIVTHAHRGKPERQTVRKVGRTLVHVSTGYGDETASYFLKSGIRNDNYGYSRVFTEGQWADRNDRITLRGELADLGWRGTPEMVNVDGGMHRLTPDQLRRIIAVLKEITE